MPEIPASSSFPVFLAFVFAIHSAKTVDRQAVLWLEVQITVPLDDESDNRPLQRLACAKRLLQLGSSHRSRYNVEVLAGELH